MTTDADLKLEAATKKFGEVVALDAVYLTVRHGELLTILGPSGSGKTTLLRVVAGFEEPTDGQVFLKGEDITYLPPAKRDIGMVFQNYALFPHMTVAENVSFPLEMRNTPKAEIRKRVEWALGIVELAGYEKRLPKQLSGGQQQRVALARAVVFDPRILLLDEPFGALDRKLREQIQLEVRRLQQKLKLTALFVTHDQEEALIMSDRIAVMNGGRIEQLAEPSEIYERPVNRFVADFIGVSNLFEGRTDSRNGDVVAVRTTDGNLFKVRTPHGVGPGEKVVLLVRPERLHLIDADVPAENRLSGSVREIVYLGESEKVTIGLAGGGDVLVRRHTEAATPLAVGDAVSVGWRADEGHLILDSAGAAA